jgi:hypothetical protein
MSRFTELKASGTDRVGFPTPRSRGHGGYACGGEPQANASGETDDDRQFHPKQDSYMLRGGI